MKKLILLFLALTSASLLAQFTNPKISVKKTVHNFGTITQGEVVNYNFEISNDGTGELKIEQVRASCGCTAAQPAKNTLKPGEKTSIKVEFNSADRLGPQEKYVYVMSNDPKNPELRLSFNCVIVDKNAALNSSAKFPKFKLMKNVIDFGNVAEGKVVDAKIAFKNEGNGVLEIRDIKTSCGCTAALASSKSLKPGESGTIRIELDTSNREGLLTRTITVYSNDVNNPNQVITLTVNIEKKK